MTYRQWLEREESALIEAYQKTECHVEAEALSEQIAAIQCELMGRDLAAEIVDRDDLPF